jgi:hypothetical protein
MNERQEIISFIIRLGITLLFTCRWSQVFSTICRDIKELFQVSSDRDTASKYEEVLISLRDQYFEVIDEENSE